MRSYACWTSGVNGTTLDIKRLVISKKNMLMKRRDLEKSKKVLLIKA